jgi:hypothetical protein
VSDRLYIALEASKTLPLVRVRLTGVGHVSGARLHIVTLVRRTHELAADEMHADRPRSIRPRNMALAGLQGPCSPGVVRL